MIDLIGNGTVPDKYPLKEEADQWREMKQNR